jgi:hypothetical protein
MDQFDDPAPDGVNALPNVFGPINDAARFEGVFLNGVSNQVQFGDAQLGKQGNVAHVAPMAVSIAFADGFIGDVDHFCFLSPLEIPCIILAHLSVVYPINLR